MQAVPRITKFLFSYVSAQNRRITSLNFEDSEVIRRELVFNFNYNIVIRFDCAWSSLGKPTKCGGFLR